jgi:hypothetical protein
MRDIQGPAARDATVAAEKKSHGESQEKELQTENFDHMASPQYLSPPA